MKRCAEPAESTRSIATEDLDDSPSASPVHTTPSRLDPQSTHAPTPVACATPRTPTALPSREPPIRLRPPPAPTPSDRSTPNAHQDAAEPRRAIARSRRPTGTFWSLQPTGRESAGPDVVRAWGALRRRLCTIRAPVLRM
ncbi:hypothetical protein B0H10DRAFT_2222739 [Mycena sp. CBHHK59/15]|nr:hypothetical protein B0H10DRAFT_2222739 [Mycena sp. CBHHK59/15]